jgi:hypothetical protein
LGVEFMPAQLLFLKWLPQSLHFPHRHLLGLQGPCHFSEKLLTSWGSKPVSLMCVNRRGPVGEAVWGQGQPWVRGFLQS